MNNLPVKDETPDIWASPLRVDKSVHEQIPKDIWKVITAKRQEDVSLGLEMLKGILDFEDWMHLRDKLNLALMESTWVKEVRYHDTL